MGIEILNLRCGFATNSSSSHSVTFYPGLTDNEEDYMEFGWGDFILASKEAKIRYLSVLLRDNLRLPKYLAIPIIRAWLNIPEDTIKIIDNLFPPEGGFAAYIDHQSGVGFPLKYGENFIDPEFFSDFKTYLMQEGLSILGGNDNEEHNRRLQSRYGGESLSSFPGVVRKEPGGIYTIFDCARGTKVRLRFNEKEIDYKTVEDLADTPELVDIKITDFCTQNCPYCYEGSSGSGEHSPLERHWRLSSSLSKLKVFEVSLGGGEPLTHPDFISIIRAYSSNGIVVNFTTRKLDFLSGKNVKEIIEKTGAIGFTPSTIGHSYEDAYLKEIEELYAHCIINDIPIAKFNIHIPLGTIREYVLEQLLETTENFGFNILLLGFKPTGRGKDFKVIPYREWVVEKTKNYGKAVSIDTALASEIKDELEELNIPEFLYQTKEGLYSCYIDAVKKELSLSSFSERRILIPELESCDIKKAFNTLQKEIKEI